VHGLLAKDQAAQIGTIWSKQIAFPAACHARLCRLLCLTLWPWLQDDQGLKTQTQARPFMHSQTNQSLAAKHILTLRCAAPRQLRVISGCLWITQSHDGCDHFLRAGESMLVHNERCVIEALSDSHFLWQEPGAVALSKTRLLGPITLLPTRWRLRLPAHVAGRFQRPFSG
jgi:Protein of unknown function (DUF2917)